MPLRGVLRTELNAHSEPLGMIGLNKISSIAFGCDPLGGHNWGIVDPNGIAAAIPAAIDRGVTLLIRRMPTETAFPRNGWGALGRRRREVLIASKFGVRINSDGTTFIDNDPA